MHKVLPCICLTTAPHKHRRVGFHYPCLRPYQVVRAYITPLYKYRVSNSVLVSAIMLAPVTSSLYPMPYRGSRKAPTFDPDDLSTLERFFEDIERMFKHAQLTDNLECIDYAISCVPNQVWHAWKSVESTSTSYIAFKSAILDLYPEVNEAHHYPFKHYEQLVNTHTEQPLLALHKYTAFYRQFLPLSLSLAKRGYLTDRRRSLDLLQVIHPQLHAAVCFRLDIQHIDCHPEDVWPVEDVNRAIVYVLHLPCHPCLHLSAHQLALLHFPVHTPLPLHHSLPLSCCITSPCQ